MKIQTSKIVEVDFYVTHMGDVLPYVTLDEPLMGRLELRLEKAIDLPLIGRTISAVESNDGNIEITIDVLPKVSKAVGAPQMCPVCGSTLENSKCTNTACYPHLHGKCVRFLTDVLQHKISFNMLTQISQCVGSGCIQSVRDMLLMSVSDQPLPALSKSGVVALLKDGSNINIAGFIAMFTASNDSVYQMEKFILNDLGLNALEDLLKLDELLADVNSVDSLMRHTKEIILLLKNTMRIPENRELIELMIRVYGNKKI